VIRSVRADGRVELGGAFVPIERPRVVERIAVAASAPIVLIVAPAGFGKSVALTQYLSKLEEPAVRFDARAEHAGLLGFARGLSEALGDVAPHARTTLAGAYERTRSSDKPGADLAIWMHAHLREFIGLLAIDDLHVAQEDPEVVRFLVALVERTKHAIRWVLASRSSAGLPVGSWLAYRDTELAVDERDLRFSFDEAKAAARAFRLAIREKELTDLLELTGGWPTAMSFALRSSTRSADLRSVSAMTREMIYRFLAEQIYAALSDEERELLAVAAVLPALDTTVLERAGFDRARALVDGLRERTAFIYEVSPERFRCHDLFREFLLRQLASEGQHHLAQAHRRAARALESGDDPERALDAYVSAGARDDAVRLLEREGFALLERARADAVERAIDALDRSELRERPRVLALRGIRAAARGRDARAESLLRRAIASAGEDRDLVAIATLRLGLLLVNAGRDAGAPLTELAGDAGQPVDFRAEASSLIAVAAATRGDRVAARAAFELTERVLAAVGSDAARAKILHRMGTAAALAGEADLARSYLSEAADLASELHLYSLASRTYAALSTLWLHEYDDVDRQLEYAGYASDAATKAGDVFDLRMAVLRMLNAQTRRGDAQRSAALEVELMRLGTDDSTLAPYVVASRAQRAAWEGRFAEALRGLASCLERVHFDADRALIGAQCALLRALLGDRAESSALAADALARTDGLSSRGIYWGRAAAQAAALCSIAETINGRNTLADRIAKRIGRSDHVSATFSSLAREFALATRLGRPVAGGALETRGAELGRSGYGDVERLLRAASAELALRVERTAEPLTAAEREVLAQIAEGLSPKEIAARSGRSVYTIQGHVANAIAKLGCRGRTEAIAAARREGFIPS